jgi:hypothetical protein
MSIYLVLKDSSEHRHNRKHHEPDEKKQFFKDAREILWNPPETWHEHMGNPREIIDMEYRELKAAETKGDMVAWRENLLHLAAACGLAILKVYNK